ncbi:MAG: DUF4136 domain-containing protein [Cyclobacteriaceae bacterium]|jgi:hypothetical protein|nr:DUF4136 domain-containing protein [Cyclobacteriaceae bacterium]
MRKILITLISVVVVGCSTVKITGLSKSNDFNIANYKSFSFLKADAGGDALENQKGNMELIKNAIENELKQHGVSRTEANGDLIVNIGVIVSKEIQTRTTDITNAADRQVTYMGQRSYEWKAGEVEVGTYRQGSVIIHLIDRASNNLVWQGAAESVLPNKQKNIPKLIDQTIKELFKDI